MAALAAPRPPPPARATLRRRSHLGAGPVAQWESVRFTRGRSLVRSQPGPLTFTQAERGDFSHGTAVGVPPRHRDTPRTGNRFGGDWENAAIDYDAKPLSPNAFEADHFYPRNTHPHLAYSLENLRASHSRCNRQRHDEEIKQTAPQQVWVKPDW
jgi:hypothetical protein